MSDEQSSGGVLVVDDEDEILELLEEFAQTRIAPAYVGR